MEIITTPNPILAEPAQDVIEIDSKIKSLIEGMWHTHTEKNALGLAATQIGVGLKVAVVGFEPSEEQLKKDPDLKPIPKYTLINPKLVWHSNNLKAEKEACLSVPDDEADVPRYDKIHVEYQDKTGKKKKLKARGVLSRIIQHELDHLNGVTIINYK